MKREIYIYTHTHIIYIYMPRARTQIYAIARIIPLLALFLRVTTQWRCHTLSPSSNQCYCFTVPLLLLFLGTRSVTYRVGKYFKYTATRRTRILQNKTRRNNDSALKSATSIMKRYTYEGINLCSLRPWILDVWAWFYR